MKTRLIPILASITLLSACEGLKAAFTAHTDVAARADNQELSVNRLGDLLGNTTLQVPVNRETANILADVWVGYQLLAVAAARGDSLNDPKLIDQATMGITTNMRLQRFMESVSKSFSADSASETAYNQASGGLFVARHILLTVAGGATQQQKDSVRRRAESIRSGLTPANFASMAKKYSADPGSATRGGDLGAFRREDMVKPFSEAVAALRPGEISQPVETQFGYHIIQRPTYKDAKAAFDQTFTRTQGQRAESLYVARLDQAANITVRSNAATTAKSVARDLPAHRNDGDVMATFKGGELTAGRFVNWLESFPEQNRIPQQMLQAPDSIVRQFVKSVARNEVMLKKADSVGIKISDDEKKQLYAEFRNLLTSMWQQLGVDPKSLADSAKSVPERERLAAARIEKYLDRVMMGQAQPIRLPMPVQTVLTSKFKSKVIPEGV